jgi:signal transduction histidine kinase
MQFEAKRSQSKEAILRDVLHTIATNPDLARCIPLILQAAQNITGAASSHFWLFDEPYSYIRVGNSDGISFHEKELKDLAESLVDGFQEKPLSIVPNTKWLIAPVRVHKNVIGVVYLLFENAQQPGTDDLEILRSLLDGIIIAASNAQARAQFETANQLTMSLLNSITDPLLVLDENRQIALMNSAAESAFNTTIDHARHKTLRDIVDSESLAALAEGGDSLEEWSTQDGLKVFAPRLAVIQKPADNSVEGWILALRDISQFKKLNRNQAEFMRIVSHDLRSPLTSMQGFASMLELGLVGELNEKQSHFVEKILAGITQMTALVDNIQDAGRYDPETGFYEMSRSQCDLGEMVNKIVQNHLVPAEKQELSISVQVADDVPIINADVNMLERAVTNLVDNAIKYTPNGGKIDVGVKRQKDEVIISVSDTGLGITPENQKHLFERHVRVARQEHKKIKGSGLGLFIVRSVAQRHGGDAWVESVENKGSTFFISIPLDGPNLIFS